LINGGTFEGKGAGALSTILFSVSNLFSASNGSLPENN
jgi:hypothetical protein